MKLSVFTAMMVEGRVFDGSGRKLSPEECIEQIAQAGFAGVEWCIGDSYVLKPAQAEREAETLGEQTRQRGLEIVSVASWANVEQPEQVRQMTEIAARLGAPGLRIGLPAYTPNHPYREQMQRSAELLAQALEIAQPLRVRLLIEIHFGFLCSSASLTARFLEPFAPEAVGVIYDAGNTVVEGGERRAVALELLGDHLNHVHAKNMQWTWTNLDWQEHPTDREHWQWQFVPLNRGIVDWDEVIAALRAVDYRGWISLEDFSTRPLDQKLKEGRTFLTELLASHP